MEPRLMSIYCTISNRLSVSMLPATKVGH